MNSRLFKSLLFLSVLGVSGYVASYLSFEIQGLLHLKSHLIGNTWYQVIFYGHLTTGMIALISGGLQFSSTLRLRKIQVHRFLGKCYVITAMMSGSAALGLSLFAHGGWSNIIGFSLFSIAWLLSTWWGLTTIKSGDLDGHIRWMTRSYACALGALTLRIWLLVHPLLQLDFDTAYQFASWGTWIINLTIAELIFGLWKQKKIYSLSGLSLTVQLQFLYMIQIILSLREDGFFLLGIHFIPKAISHPDARIAG